MIALAVAAGWGLAEALLFIIVADVPVSLIAARRGWRAGAGAALSAALGAAIGGGIVWAWSRAQPDTVAQLYAALPGISPAMIADAVRGFAQHGWSAALVGAFSGVPYKLYAHAAAVDGASLPALLLMTPLVRLPRFLLIAAGAALIGRWGNPRIGAGRLSALLLAGWALFYAWYFHVMPA
jgi:hypothetical protein